MPFFCDLISDQAIMLNVEWAGADIAGQGPIGCTAAFVLCHIGSHYDDFGSGDAGT